MGSREKDRERERKGSMGGRETREVDREGEREVGRERDRKTEGGRQRGRETETDQERGRQKEKERDGEGGRKRQGKRECQKLLTARGKPSTPEHTWERASQTQQTLSCQAGRSREGMGWEFGLNRDVCLSMQGMQVTPLAGERTPHRQLQNLGAPVRSPGALEPMLRRKTASCSWRGPHTVKRTRFSQNRDG